MNKLAKNWKTLFTVCLIFGLVGCSGECRYVDDCKMPNKKAVFRADKICDDHMGIDKISWGAHESTKVFCQDGHSEDLDHEGK